MRSLTLTSLFLAVLTLSLLAFSPSAHAQSIRGMDLSMLQHLEDHGVEYRQAGRPQDPLVIFKAHGVNWVRLRLFVKPDGKEGQVNTLEYTLRLAKRLHAAELKWILDFHYSDAWADPEHQFIPAEWSALNHQQLTDRVFAYTRDTLALFEKNNCPPDMVAIGNEITNGMLWPDAGPLWITPPASTTAPTTQKSTRDLPKWDRMTDHLLAGIRGLRAVDPQSRIPIMIHIDKGHSKAISRDFFDFLEKRNVPFDYIGLSYYPFWNGTLAELKDNLHFLAGRYNKPIIIAETAYDTYGGPQGNLPYPITNDGQKQFMEELFKLVASTPDNKGAGIIYWAPEWIRGDKWNAPTWSGQWENRALFDPSGTPRPALSTWQIKP